MPALFIYLIKVNVALLIFCAGYYAVLRHLTFYNLNRVYLVTAIIFSTLYPKVNVSDFLNRHEEIAKPIQVVVVNWQEPVKTIAKTFAGHDQWYWLQAAFWAGVCVFAIRLGVQLLSLYRLHKRSEPAQLHQYMIRVIKGDLNPFSFWKNIYINPDNHPPHELSAILEHEQIHVNEWHTLDILLGEVSAICYWFNPGIWLMKRAIRENIEFITDQKILQKGVDSKAYQYSLLNVNFGAQHNTIVNHFNISTIKKRIMMMNAKRSSNVNITRYLFLIPAVMVLLLIFSTSKAELKKAVKNSKHMMFAIKTEFINISLKAAESAHLPIHKTEMLPNGVSFFNLQVDTIKNLKLPLAPGEMIKDDYAEELSNATGKDSSGKKYERLNYVQVNGNVKLMGSLHASSYSYTTAASRDTDVKMKLVIRNTNGGDTKPLVYVNGKKVDDLNAIDVREISELVVKKDESPNGAIYITTGGKREPVKILNIRKIGDTVYTIGGNSKVDHITLTRARPGMSYSTNSNTITVTSGSDVKRVLLNGRTVDPKDVKVNKVLINGDTIYTTTLSHVSSGTSPRTDSLLNRMNGTIVVNGYKRGTVSQMSKTDSLVNSLRGYSVDAKGNVTQTTAGTVRIGGGGGRVVAGQALTIKPAPINFANKLIIIDGKEVTEKEMKKVSADKLETISNLSYETAKALYGDKAKNGVVVITTKK